MEEIRLEIKLFSSNVLWSVYNFRVDLLSELKELGYEIHVLAKNDKYKKKLEDKNFIVHTLNINNNKNATH